MSLIKLNHLFEDISNHFQQLSIRVYIIHWFILIEKRRKNVESCL
ncbi:hypothetical protein [Enterococcus faecium]|nr:hypothetical protein [Enterococcus faecium]